jgi:hypothetical protein
MISSILGSTFLVDFILFFIYFRHTMSLSQKVQVKKIKSMEIGYWWVIEPYEEGCNCPDLVYPSEAKSDGY